MRTFSECLRQELEPFNVFVTLIEPGGVRTGFSRNLQFATEILAYRGTPAGSIRAMFSTPGNELYTLDPQKVAQAVFDVAATDDPPLRVTLGGDAYEVVQSALQSRLTNLRSQEALARSVALER
jgi:short-subunit dehydrogenase